MGQAPIFRVSVLRSFQCVVPPFLDTNAPPEKRGMWLGIFYFASPVGTALGYAWGGVLGSSPLTWRAAFLLEIAPVAIFLPLLWVAPYHRRRVGDGVAAPMAASDVAAAAGAESEHHPLIISGGGGSSGAAESRAALKVGGDIVTQGVGASALSGSLPGSPRSLPEQPAELPPLPQPLPQRPSFIAELRAAMTNVLFLLVALGNAGWTAVIMGLGAFGPTFTLVRGVRIGPRDAPPSRWHSIVAKVAHLIIRKAVFSRCESLSPCMFAGPRHVRYAEQGIHSAGWQHCGRCHRRDACRQLAP